MLNKVNWSNANANASANIRRVFSTQVMALRIINTKVLAVYPIHRYRRIQCCDTVQFGPACRMYTKVVYLRSHRTVCTPVS